MSKLSFGERLCQILSNDPNFGKLIDKVLLPTESALRRVKVSSAIGYTLTKTIGLGWSSTTTVTILFKDCPIDRVMIYRKNKGFNVYFYFPIVGSSEDLNKTCFIEPKTKGLFVKQTIGAHIPSQKHLRNCLGSEGIEKDTSLLTEIFELFQTNRFNDVRGFAKIIIEIKYLFDKICLFGEIQTNLGDFYGNEEQLQNDVIKKLFRCSLRIATIIQNAFEKNFIKSHNLEVLEREKRYLERKRLGLDMPQCKVADCDALPTRVMRTSDNRIVRLCERHLEEIKLLSNEERLKKLELLADSQKEKKEHRPS